MSQTTLRKLENKIALVAGATRGAGRGIACALGEAGATVYCTGRSTRANRPAAPPKRKAPFDYTWRPETIEETAEMVTARGGKGIAVEVDHTRDVQVEALIARIRKEQGGLDVLVNDIWGGDALTEFGKSFWKVSLESGRKMLDQAVFSHIITAHYAAPLMIQTRGGLIVEITDGDSYTYRGNVFYDLVKTSVIRLAFIWARELRRWNITSVAVTPGFLRSEAMLDHFGVTEANWRDAGKKDPNFLASESPLFVGRAVAALAADPDIAKKSGRAFSSWALSEEYGFTDADGSRPHWGNFAREKFGKPLKTCDDSFYEHWVGGPVDEMFADWPQE